MIFQSLQKNKPNKKIMKKNVIFMATTLFLFTGLISLSACGGSSEKPKEQTAPADSTKVAAYVCPMGDSKGSDSPGKCPKCGMDFVKNDKALK